MARAAAEVIRGYGPCRGILHERIERLGILPGPAAVAEEPTLQGQEQRGLVVAIGTCADEEAQLREHTRQHGRSGAMHADHDHRRTRPPTRGQRQ